MDIAFTLHSGIYSVRQLAGTRNDLLPGDIPLRIHRYSYHLSQGALGKATYTYSIIWCVSCIDVLHKRIDANDRSNKYDHSRERDVRTLYVIIPRVVQ